MITPQGCSSSSSSFPIIMKKTEPGSSSLSISKFVDDIAVGNVSASSGPLSCSAPTPRPTYLQALLGDNPPLLGPFNQAKERLGQPEDFPELISSELLSTKYGDAAGLFSSQLGSEEDSLGFSFSCSSLSTPYQRFVPPTFSPLFHCFLRLSGGTGACPCQRWAPACPSVPP